MTDRQTILIISLVGLIPALIHGFNSLPAYAWCAVVASAFIIAPEAFKPWPISQNSSLKRVK